MQCDWRHPLAPPTSCCDAACLFRAWIAANKRSFCSMRVTASFCALHTRSSHRERSASFMAPLLQPAQNRGELISTAPIGTLKKSRAELNFV